MQTGFARMTELKLHAPGGASSLAAVTVTDRGRLRNAAQISVDVCEGHVSRRWVIDRMGPEIGTKPGREWLFYENDARAWWTAYLERTGGRQ